MHGLWQFVSTNDDAESDGNEVDLYAQYIEISKDNVTFYITDGIANCYEADSNSLAAENIDTSLYLDPTESTLFIGNPDTAGWDAETNTFNAVVKFKKVENINSQDFNLCTF